MTQMRHLNDVILNFTPVRGFTQLCSMSNLMLRLSVSNIEVLRISTTFLELGEYSFEYGYYWEMLGKDMFENCDANFFRLKRLVVNSFKFENLETRDAEVFSQQGRSLGQCGTRTVLEMAVRSIHSRAACV
ncbi:uncharacterized protein LOC131313792 [Rhododendron vialii]|uniref:uncharacterized protein LOC131313792 n=1 Tax=Rhododendron vialii TaxID=182163 RepID=UPI00265E4170|nr:uncharacterized protein LOC131313792 [Rhododendron vialii]